MAQHPADSLVDISADEDARIEMLVEDAAAIVKAAKGSI